MTFADLNINKPLRNAIDDLGFTEPTPIQAETFAIIRSGRNIVGIAQTGTGKTLAFLLPVLQDLKFSKQLAPRVLILVPTRELVLQVVEQAELLTKYSNTRIMGVYGGTNINTQNSFLPLVKKMRIDFLSTSRKFTNQRWELFILINPKIIGFGLFDNLTRELSGSYSPRM